ncbi:MAG: hypothetical protein COW24_05490 [Candidatus Kerfeldbacteria bacterium CG15_BIG_FIL_POST_REV_8_21_14_020_45_12]|uniref:DUF948 domain-containing protein n=1 Tax=Candidatus Kerfeldbacteria bacterium CG15_BIG_FIL_POST_REV_8_21_14_020_45_12 TaxID=2014247 RepID=A0A2M7H2K3_9BACT|nr:MAG: hypothetical protein COW24_05490 [Candidatus Kerfeldbacteria bacterium CG15_BIG_FIL_POST_REV_8_21_14_020_45_12]PJA93599.1 MAG: hypothetical protein CO132_02340 [Candidatus Kerfeldbacteria bacterium CG_4_9_14_3_um_filter_45_8]
MFSTSVDLLYGVIALSVLVFTAFLVWIMYYIAQILRQGNEVIIEIREKIEEFTETLDEIKDKVLASANSISFVASQIGGVVDFIQERKDRKTVRKRPSSKK